MQSEKYIGPIQFCDATRPIVLQAAKHTRSTRQA